MSNSNPPEAPLTVQDILNALNLPDETTHGDIQKAEQALYQAMQEVIGVDEKFTNIQMTDHTGKPTSKVYEEAFSLHQTIRNQLRAEQRTRLSKLFGGGE